MHLYLIAESGECNGGDYVGNGGMVTSHPQNPYDNYDNNINCRYNFTISFYPYVVLIFTEFETELGYDYVRVSKCPQTIILPIIWQFRYHICYHRPISTLFVMTL